MINSHIATQIYENFGFEPTFGQKKIIDRLAEFLAGEDFEAIFILNGHAGTGKTSLLGAFVKTLKALNIKPILLAPTGRAAKVLSLHAGERATTIHRRIYRARSAADPDTKYALDINRDADAVFVVDEASMLANFAGEGAAFGSGNLLDDLIDYVRAGKRCRLVLVGDSAQLPPVGLEESPALDVRQMRVYGDIIHETLDEVVRQGSESGILFNATLVRCMLDAQIYEPPLLRTSFDDVRAISGGELIEAVEECYARYGRDDTMIITRSNKRASRFNEGVRRHILQAEEAIESGDMLMVVRNNYHWTEEGEQQRMEFIANGDIARLGRLRRFEELYGFRFAEAVLRFPDYDDYEVECKVLLDTLSGESPALTREQSNQLFRGVEADYPEHTTKSKRYAAVREDDFYNAVQIKFAYAVTCHKAQGGQWSAVFVDQAIFGDEAVSRDTLRWLYTAITRATQRLYFVNFDERFLEEE